MKYWCALILGVLSVVYQAFPLMGETVRLKSGRKVELIDGKLQKKVAEEIYREAEGLMKKGRLDLTSDYLQLILNRAKGRVVSQARAAQEKARKIEYGSFVVLRNSEVRKGKVQAHLRADLLGLEGKDKIPLWDIEEIVAEYHVGFSRVTKTFYPMTILEIKSRNRGIQTSRITGEIEFVVKKEDGSVVKEVLGKAYELLRDRDLARQIDAMTEDRIIKVVIYPDLRTTQ